MTTRYPGGLIRKTPPTITPPVDGEGGSAPGVWTLEQASYYTKQGTWPKPILPRQLFTWALNSEGQLGQNDRVTRSSPVQVGALTDWYVLSSGVNIEQFLAIKTDGTLWGWGRNEQGQLGFNDVVNRSSPTQIGALTNWSSVSGSDTRTIAIKTNGTLWAWGENNFGELGQNNRIGYSSPVQIGALTTWQYAKIGLAIAYAIKTDGTLWSWGANNVGQLGQNDGVNRSSPVQVGSGTTWYKLGIRGEGFIGTKTDGTLWSWGQNENGQIGNNSLVNASSPVQIGALTTWSYVGNTYATSAAIRTDGTLWVWGLNSSNGQLGLNDIVNRSSPVQVGSGTDWSSINQNYRGTLAIKTGGTLWSWGYNANGQLGQNDRTNRSSPVQVGALTTWLFASPGAYSMAAFKSP